MGTVTSAAPVFAGLALSVTVTVYVPASAYVCLLVAVPSPALSTGADSSPKSTATGWPPLSAVSSTDSRSVSAGSSTSVTFTSADSSGSSGPSGLSGSTGCGVNVAVALFVSSTSDTTVTVCSPTTSSPYRCFSEPSRAGWPFCSGDSSPKSTVTVPAGKPVHAAATVRPLLSESSASAVTCGSTPGSSTGCGVNVAVACFVASVSDVTTICCSPVTGPAYWCVASPAGASSPRWRAVPSPQFTITEPSGNASHVRCAVRPVASDASASAAAFGCSTTGPNGTVTCAVPRRVESSASDTVIVNWPARGYLYVTSPFSGPWTATLPSPQSTRTAPLPVLSTDAFTVIRCASLVSSTAVTFSGSSGFP